MTARAFAVWACIAFAVGFGVAFALFARADRPTTTPDAALVARADSLDAVRAALAQTQAALAHVRDSVERIAAADAAERRRTRAAVATLAERLALYDSLPTVPRDTVAAFVAACRADADAADVALASCASARDAIAAERDTALDRVATTEVRVVVADSLRVNAERATADAERATRRERIAKWGAALVALLALVLR